MLISMKKCKEKVLILLLSFLLILSIFVIPTIGKILDREKIRKVANNRPPNPPEINGPTSVVVRRYYNYSFKLTDPDGDYLSKLEIDWGDGTFYEICGCDKFLENGTIVEAQKMWKRTGNYQIKARAADTYNEWSDWAYHPVSAPVVRLTFLNPHKVKSLMLVKINLL
ncbi:MAG: hypothetical protein QW279_11910 [Candidatus Jordarchaeaceae archaeon]